MKTTNVIEILKRRGFLIKEKDDRYYLDSRTLSQEKTFLKEILKKFNLGVYIDNTLSLNVLESDTLYDEIFEKGYKTNGMESVYVFEEFDDMIHCLYIDKFRTDYIEPYVARYVEALNLIGIHTFHSCDGNHKDRIENNVEVGIKTPYVNTHKILWDSWLSKYFNIEWDNTLSNDLFRIPLTPDNKEYIYESLYQAANMIIENKNKLIKCHTEACKEVIKQDETNYSLTEKDREGIYCDIYREHLEHYSGLVTFNNSNCIEDDDYKIEDIKYKIISSGPLSGFFEDGVLGIIKYNHNNETKYLSLLDYEGFATFYLTDENPLKIKDFASNNEKYIINKFDIIELTGPEFTRVYETIDQYSNSLAKKLIKLLIAVVRMDEDDTMDLIKSAKNKPLEEIDIPLTEDEEEYLEMKEMDIE